MDAMDGPMKLPVGRAIAASGAYVVAHIADLLRVLWLPTLLLVAALFFVLPRYMGPMAEIAAMGPAPDPSAVIALMGPAFKWIGAALLANAVFYPIAYAGVLKHVVRGESPRLPFYLRFGGDEWRVLAAFVLLVVMISLVYLVGALGTLALGAALAALAPAAANAVVSAGVVAFAAVVLWFCLRLSLIFPATIATRRIGLPTSWAATRGNVWRLVPYFLVWAGATLVLAILYMALTTPDYFSQMAGIAAASDDPVRAQELEAEMFRKQAEAWSPTSPGFALRASLTYVYTLAIMVLWTVPAAVAWRYISGESGAR